MILPLLLALAAPAPVPAEAEDTSAPSSPAPAPATVEAPPERHKLLLLDFRDDGVGESAVRVIHDSLASHLSKDARFEVVSSEDVRRAIAFEAQKTELGCSDDGCLAEIAGALGARLLLHGTAGKLGDLVVVNVSLYDASAARSIGKETIEADKIDALLPKLRDAGDRLMVPLFGEPAHDGGDVLLWSGVGVGAVGLVTTTIALIVAGANAQAVTDEPDFVDKKTAAGVRDGSLVAAAAGGAVLLAGAVISGMSFLE
jgi:TolB-like protein